MIMYQVIYADPPWRYAVTQSNSRKIENQYPTMEVADICALNVPSADNAVLYLWATAPLLVEALQVMEAWGFTYKTSAVWDKEHIGMGYWFRVQHELLLVGTKGQISPPDQDKRVSSVFRQARGQHSRKPDGIRALISQWFPDAKRLEMFGRPANESLFDCNDWDIFGNEMEQGIVIQTRNNEA